MKKLLIILPLFFSLTVFSQVPTFEELKTAHNDLRAFKDKLISEGYEISYFAPVSDFPEGGSYILEYRFPDGLVEVDIYHSSDQKQNELSVWFYDNAKLRAEELAKEFAESATSTNSFYCGAAKSLFIDFDFNPLQGRIYTDAELDSKVIELCFELFDCAEYADF